ncbi:MAG: hypothetical protein IKR34_08085, partial [Candidatus Gastranaerophilales bacterium]|nr:hypothetical protein [Candidatus Gastranaerophilales bacterium]
LVMTNTQHEGAYRSGFNPTKFVTLNSFQGLMDFEMLKQLQLIGWVLRAKTCHPELVSGSYGF